MADAPTRPTRVFISCSIDKKPGPWQTRQKKWADDLKDCVRNSSQYNESEIYLFTDLNTAPTGEPIKPGIDKALKEAEHLICVISDEFLESLWCLYEYQEYTSRTDPMHSNPIFVVTDFLNEQSHGQKEDFESQLRRGVESMKSRKDSLKSEKLMQFAETDWIKIILAACHENRHIDLYFKPMSEARKPLRENLVRPRIRFVLEYAGLSAYCLGADRYYGGGWGFSLENTFHYDDGGELPNGPYGLNVVVLRALNHVLGSNDLLEEHRAVFPLEPIARNTMQAVSDRLPRFAALMSCLEHINHMVGDLFIQASAVQSAMEGFGPKSRWTLENIDLLCRSEEYYAAVLACLSLAEEVKKEKAAGPLLEQARLFKNGPSLALFEEQCKRAIFENDLIRMLAGDYCEGGSPKLEDVFRAAMIWLMLANSPAGRHLLANHTNEFVNKAGSDASTGLKLVNCVVNLISKGDPRGLTVSLALCASILSCAGEVGGTFPKTLLDALHNNLFDCIESYKFVPSLNSVAWAAIVLIAAHESQASIGSANLAPLWEDGRALRKARLDYVKDLSERNQLSASKLKQWKYPFLLTQIQDWVKHPGNLFYRVNAESDEQLQAFAEALTDANFWGPEPPPPSLTREDSTLAGVLRVTCGPGTETVEMDSPGYNQIFLRPFSHLTGMNVLDLSGIRREFGGLDKMLVKLMGETVVDKVYVRSGDKYKCNGLKFDRRTEVITKRLTESCISKSNLEEGMDDFLIVREAGDKTRLIHRSAIVHRPRKEGDPGIISWRFLEMPESAKCLLEEPDIKDKSA